MTFSPDCILPIHLTGPGAPRPPDELPL